MSIYQNSRANYDEKVDAIVVLGASQWNGKPSPVLKARLDHAYGLYKNGIADYVVLTGGMAKGDKISESKVGKNYLSKKGIPANKILIEEKGMTTKESLKNITGILNENNFNKILFVSHGYHLYRVKKIAKNNNINDIYVSAVELQDKELKFKYIIRESFINILYLVNPNYKTAKR
ncbi:MAG: YdcF family protein [Thermodesulfobacteriota bacterium]